MIAFEISEYGATPALVEKPQPVPGPGEILVRIAATGLNFADLLMIKGQYQERPMPPVTLGMEIAGTIDAVGADVTKFRPGDRIAVYSGQGGLADFGCFPVERAVLIPDQMPFEHAAGFLITHGTSHLALSRRARLAPNETLLVLGAAGGVGLTAVEIGKLMGARVIACARGQAKLDVAKAAGADHVIDSDASDLRDQVKALGGADVVYDPIGGDLFKTALRCVNPEARILVIGFASGDVPQIPANHLLVKNVDVIGLNFGAYLKFAPDALTASFQELLKWYEAGQLHPHISHRFPLSHAAEGLETLRARKSTGKIIVTPT